MTYATRGGCQYSPHALRPYGIRGASLRKCVVKRGVISLCGHVRSVHYNANGTNTFVYRAGIPSRRDNAITKVTVVTLPPFLCRQREEWVGWLGVRGCLQLASNHPPRASTSLSPIFMNLNVTVSGKSYPACINARKKDYPYLPESLAIPSSISNEKNFLASGSLTVSTFLEHDTECILNYTMLIGFVYIIANVF